MSLDLPALAAETIAADSRVDGKTIATRISGAADTEGRAALDAYIKRLHTEATRLGVTNVTIDLRELEFMNSSCLKIFVTWLAQLRELPAAQQYKIAFLSNPSLLWQRRSLAALSCFAIDLVTIET